jgi:glycogen synthase
VTPGSVLLTTDVVGGVWDFATCLARELTAHGTRTVLLVLGQASGEHRLQARHAGAELVSLPVRLEWMQNSQADVRRTQQYLAELVADVRPDVVHANQFAAACAGLRVPVVLSLHSDVLSWRKWTLRTRDVPSDWHFYTQLVRTALAQADQVVAVSRFLADEARELYHVQRPIHVVHNGWLGRARPVDRRPARTLLAGRLWDAAKNLRLVTEAVPRLPRHPGEVLVAGDQRHPDTGGLVEVPAPIRPLGFVPREQLDALLRRTRVCLSAAVYDPFGLLPLQAALAGCALLLSDIPSYREIWGDAALFFQPHDPDDLRNQWVRLLEDDLLCGRLARAAQQRALTRYSASRMAEGYRSIYQRVAAGVAA